MNIDQAKRVLEAFLFVSVSPLRAEKISQIIEIDNKTIAILIDDLNKEYNEVGHCFHIREIAGGYQMFTRSEYAEWINKLFVSNSESRLSNASIETLAIIAYKQPITRIEVEDIRGVNVSYVLRKLIDKKLVTMAGRKQVPGRPILYRTTRYFLSYFGLKDIKEMPQPSEFKDLLSQEGATANNEE